jgi:isopentenyl-diphosphate delta-isomerase type 1
MEKVILVDENDNEIGEAEKIKAHQDGLLHRAFSIAIYRQESGHIEYLLQKRNKYKYHSGGLWANACCGHPRPNEELSSAANRRLQEEMGLEAKLTKVGVYKYKAEVGNNLIEHEMDHIFIGQWQGGSINPAPEEIEEYCWLTAEEINERLIQRPNNFAAWFAGVHKVVTKAIHEKN